MVMLGHRNRFTAATRHLVDEIEQGTMNSKYRNFATAGIYRQQRGMICGESDRALRCKRIGGTPASAPPRGKQMRFAERSVLGSFVSDDFILVCGICHHEYGT